MRSRQQQRQPGFSLLEVAVVALVILILAAIALPTVTTAIANVRLRGSASSLSGLIQNARLLAVKSNAVYTVRFTTGTLSSAYVDLNGNGGLDSGEPLVQFGGNVTQVAAPSGTPPALDDPSGPLGWTATAGNVSFNPRGLPCDVTQTPCAPNVGYAYYLRDARGGGTNGWAAVSVTAAGRIKVWTWNGSAWTN